MATVNFSVPDDLKAAFNAAFEGRNKSAVIAGLMREAIERAYTLEPVSVWELPAIQSMAHLTYATAPIRTGLYRVRGRRE